MVSFGAAVAVAVTAYLCAWYQLRVSFYYAEAVRLRVDRLDFRDALERHKAKVGSYPIDLAELQEEDVGRRRDIWGTPYVYKRIDSSYEIWSLGHDGEEGGIGFDADIH